MNVALTRADEEALLCRPVRPLITKADRDAFGGQRCVVTGAGGSIGSELARQLASCGPGLLTLVDQSELHLFQIERELAERWPRVTLDPVLADVNRPEMMRLACERSRPHVVFHAAAYKHVTMAERAVCAAARVNVLGTSVVVAAARAVGARLLLISSDKAAAPRSVMGATKRVAELVTVGAARPGFRGAVVRFGNVLASSGSVITLMQDCINRGKPLRVTDPDATRYFMTVGEAASLVLKADVLALAGETFWLDMGEPVRIGDLANRVLALAARQGHPAVPIEIVGLRPGEKRDEQLTTQGLEMRVTVHPRIFTATQARVPRRELDAAMRALSRHVRRADAWGVLHTLASIVPDYEPSAEARAAAAGDRVGPFHDDATARRLLSA